MNAARSRRVKKDVKFVFKKMKQEPMMPILDCMFAIYKDLWYPQTDQGFSHFTWQYVSDDELEGVFDFREKLIDRFRKSVSSYTKLSDSSVSKYVSCFMFVFINELEKVDEMAAESLIDQEYHLHDAWYRATTSEPMLFSAEIIAKLESAEHMWMEMNA